MKNKGWTIVETIVVIALMGIVLGIGIPQFQKYISRAKLENAKSEIFATLRVARSNALSEQITYQVIFDESANSYRMVPGGGSKVLPDGVEINNSVDITYEFHADRTANVNPSNLVIKNTRNQNVEFSLVAATGYIEVIE